MPAIPNERFGVTLMDINGDGVPDLVQSTCGNSSPDCPNGSLVAHTWINQYVPPSIIHFPNGVAADTIVNYMPITSPFAGFSFSNTPGPIYSDPSTTLAPGTTFLAVPIRVVYQVLSDDGNDGQAKKMYQYTSLRGSAFGRGPQGFSSVIETDYATNTTTTTQYAQAYPYTGMPTSVERDATNASGLGSLILSTTTTQYCDVPNFDPTSGDPSPCTPIGSGPSVPGTSTFVYPSVVKD